MVLMKAEDTLSNNFGSMIGGYTKLGIQAVEKTDMRTGLGMYRDRRLAMSIRRRYGVRLGLS
jgi:hypothetical protein